MSKLVETTSNFFWSSVVGVIKLDNFDFTCEKIEIYCDLYVGVLSKTLKFWNVFVCCNVIIQFTFFYKASITYAAFEKLLSFMNWSHVYIQASLSYKACITYICCPWNAFFPSWTDAKCPIISPFCVKLASHMLHLKGFFPSWTDAMCPLICSFF